VIDHDTSLLLGRLVLGRSVASLATIHEGRPFASMIPYAVLVTGRDPDLDDDATRDAGSVVLVSHVSRLSAHTRDMLTTPEVCLLITAPEPTDSSGSPPQALPRVSLPAMATFIDAAHPAHEALKMAYLTRFPHAAEWFQLGDFSIVVFEPTSARFIAGFARAMTLSPTQFHAAVAAAAATA
jgi:hypothetical protein